MSKVNVVAIEPVNGHGPGARFEVSEREARQLEAKRLVKMDAPVSNKMKPQAENKANPSPAAGKAQTSSALPAARASARKTATKSVAGEKAPTTGE